MSIRVVIPKKLQKQESYNSRSEFLTALKIFNDFKLYKKNSHKPLYFGKDVPNDFPEFVAMEDIWHVHIADSILSNAPNWTENCDTSDTMIVYCYGDLDKEHIFIIAIEGPPAHTKNYDNNYREKWANAARSFRTYSNRQFIDRFNKVP